MLNTVTVRKGDDSYHITHALSSISFAERDIIVNIKIVYIPRLHVQSHACTGPKLMIRFPTCPAYPNMTFPTHICQRIEQNFMQTNEMCRKS